MNKALRYQMLVHAKKACIKEKEYGHNMHYHTALCFLTRNFFINTKGRYDDSKNSFINLCDDLLLAVSKLEFDFFLNQQIEALADNFEIFSVQHIIRNCGAHRVKGYFLWPKNNDGYEKRLLFLDIAISYYNPRNKRSAEECIQKHLKCVNYE